ncbi:fructosamine kinase family protein [Alistipes sp.]|uniref:fructosamine kinase family protein n=1 Tax=Alistipes sp. TaxID=1872444 RepID=UPI003AF50AAA
MNTNLKTVLETAIGDPITSAVSGTGKIRTKSGAEYFLKSGAPSESYVCEAEGLKELSETGIFRTPKVLSVGTDHLLTEYVPNSAGGNDFFEDFGRRLARLHRRRTAYFGFRRNNYIGLNPQINLPHGAERSDWTAFYLNKRLRYQYELAERNGYATTGLRRNFARLESKIADILQGCEEPPCLLHGDLWAGNFLCDAVSGEVVLIDPAVYYGHREADLAMTRLFGGFPPAFYRAYEQEYPLKPRWEYREGIYRLYHLLNHLNLFGSSYLPEANRILEKYASD